VASISLSLPLGADGLVASQYVVGVLAPNVPNSCEVRIDLANSAMNKKQVDVMLESIKLALISRNDVTTTLP
jgi:hypothetical protein